MNSFLRTGYAKVLASYLAAALLALSTLAGAAEAMFLETGRQAGASAALTEERAADLAAIQASLEQKTVKQRLMDYGLTPDEALAKLQGLSDQDLHQFAANLNAVQAGGDILVDLVLIALLVVLLIYILEGRIAIKRR